MTVENHIHIDSDGDQTRLPWLGMYRLNRIEKQLLSDSLRHLQVFTEGQFPSDVARQSLLALIAADKSIAQAAPGLYRLIEKVRADSIEGIYVTNLPTEKPISYLLSLTLSSSIGSVFNYGLSDGQLVMEVGSFQDEQRHVELGLRTEGSWVAREQRAEWICLLGVESAPWSYTAYAPIKPVEHVMTARARSWLYSPSAFFRRPQGAVLGATWSVPTAVLSRSPRGHTEIVWPGDAASAARPDDPVGAAALAELSAELNRLHVKASLDPGCFFAFNNVRGAYRQATSGDGSTLFYKTYTRHSLRALQMKGETGPIFSFPKSEIFQKDPAGMPH
jgi:hypothetical protein